MYEDKMTRLKHERKRLQELNSQSDDEVKTVIDLQHFSLQLEVHVHR